MHIKDSTHGVSFFETYRSNFASISAITASQSFSSIIDNDDDDDAMILEQARKDVLVISPVMMKYSRSSSLNIQGDEVDVEENTPRSKNIVNLAPMKQENTTATMKRKHISHRRCGIFDNAPHDHGSVEFNKTYIHLRIDEDIAKFLMSKLTCSVPLFHTRRPNHSTSPIADLCSEPLASNFYVRGPTYLQDGEKIPSQEAIFAVIGTDSIMRPKDRIHELKMNLSAKPDSFVRRFQKACYDFGFQAPFMYAYALRLLFIFISLHAFLDHIPIHVFDIVYRLVINFVVPWGNLVTYHFRPDGSPDGRPYPDNDNEYTPTDRLLVKFLSRDDRVSIFIP